MDSPLLSTKYFIPPAGAKKLFRERLFLRLDEGLCSQSRLTLVCAPAGYGKTTLVADWIRRLTGPACAWFSLDEADNDPTLFFSYLIAALQATLPGAGDTARLLLQSPQPVPLQTVLSSLANDLAQIGREIVLVLDDYHVIRTQAVHTGLEYLIDHLPPNAHLAVTTRSDPPFPLHRYRGRGQMVEIRLDDLRFTSAEISTFLNELSGFHLQSEEIDILENRTEGWIAGLQMAALSMRTKEDKAQFIRSLAGSHRFILDYLAEEVLNDQPGVIQQFLLRTSILNRMCGPLCDALVPPAPAGESGQDVLENLERSNLFLIPLDEERCWYRYHHLFADLLRVRLQQSLRAEPGSIAELHRQAAGWLEANGWTGEAIQHFITAGEFEKAAALVEEHTLRLFAQGELHTLLQWIHLLPSELASSRPWLCICQAWALVFAGQNPETEAALRQAEQAIAAGKVPLEERLRLRGEIIAIRGIAALTSGDIHSAAALRDLPADAIPAGSLFARSVARWVSGYVARLQGDLPYAIRTFEEVRELGLQLNNIWTLVSASVDLGESLRQSGRLRAAESVFREALQAVSQSTAPNPGYLGRLEAFLASLLLERNEVEQAVRLVRSAIEHNRRWENPNHITYAWLVFARICKAQQDFSAAQHALDMANQAIAHRIVVPNLVVAAEMLQIRLWLAQGKTAAAEQWAAAQPPDQPASYNEETAYHALTLARVRLATGDPSGAIELLTRLEADARAGGKIAALIETLVLKALAANDPSHPQTAQSALAEALDLGVVEGYRRIFLEEGRPIRDLLEACQARLEKDGPAGSEVHQVEQIATLLAAFGEPASTPTSAGAPLTGREIEILACMAEGLTNPQIGARLYISAGTVKAHSAAIYRKLDVLNRSEAISRAKDLGLI